MVRVKDEGAKAKGKKSSKEQLRIEVVPLSTIRPAKVNDRIYKVIDPDDSQTLALVASIEKHGQLTPIHVSSNGVIISGHRRYAACRLAGLETIKIIREAIHSDDSRFELFVVEHNEQRVKSRSEQLREEIVRTSPDDAHNALLESQSIVSSREFMRAKQSGLRVIRSTTFKKKRPEITSAKMPMLDAAKDIINKYEKYWPLTLRQIHYRLLGKYVLFNANVPGVFYSNTLGHYKSLSDLLTRGRLEGLVPWESMHDPTRTRTNWQQWDNVGEFAREQMEGILGNYKRNLIQSQPSYIELVVEKTTVLDIAKRAAGFFHVSVGVGKGYDSTTNLEETAERFHSSGKDHFQLLIAGDLDPEGENICETWADCLRHEHDIENMTVCKVGVNPDQVKAYGLQPLPVKESSSRAANFIEQHGNGA